MHCPIVAASALPLHLQCISPAAGAFASLSLVQSCHHNARVGRAAGDVMCQGHTKWVAVPQIWDKSGASFLCEPVVISTSPNLGQVQSVGYDPTARLRGECIIVLLKT